MAFPVNPLRQSCVIWRYKALFDRAFLETVVGKNRVHLLQTPEKTSIDGITRVFCLLQEYAISGKLMFGTYARYSMVPGEAARFDRALVENR